MNVMTGTQEVFVDASRRKRCIIVTVRISKVAEEALLVWSGVLVE